MKIFTVLTGQKLEDQESKEVVRIFGTLLVALSGLILFSDKVLTFDLKNNYGYHDTSTFIWVLSQTLSPFILVFSSIFKPYKTSYIIPVYFYAIQLYWIFDPSIKFDDYLLQTYAIGVSIGFIFLAYILNEINKIKTKIQIENELFKQETISIIELIREKKLNKKAI